jgi:hypothetical protein
MKKFSLLFAFAIAFAIIGSFFVGGCTTAQKEYAVQTSMIATDSAVLKDEYVKVEKKLRELQKTRNMFDENEWMTLTDIDASIDEFIEKFEHMSEYDIATISVSEIKYLYNIIQMSYVEGKKIIASHWDEIPVENKINLEVFDEKASEIDSRIKELLENPDNENINTAMKLISGAASLTIKILSSAGAIPF